MKTLHNIIEQIIMIFAYVYINFIPFIKHHLNMDEYFEYQTFREFIEDIKETEHLIKELQLK